MINEVADAVIARLKGRNDFQGWKVEHFPDTPSRYPFSAAQFELLVNYNGSTDGDTTVMPAMTERMAKWAVTILVRSLRGPKGASSAIDNVRKALHGWTPPQGGTAFAPLSDGFIGEDEGVWKFVVVFAHSIPSITDPDAGNEPTFKTTDLDPHLDTSLIGGQ